MFTLAIDRFSFMILGLEPYMYNNNVAHNFHANPINNDYNNDYNNIDVKDSNGRTALHRAIIKGINSFVISNALI